tara:strand:- start:1253 stop:1687 length:435 start_codon:yes stop_codon:yes gene_type:complete
MNKTSKVTNVQADGTWKSKQYNTTFYKFEVSFENGDTGEYSSKSPEQNKFVVGQEAEYTLENGQYGNKIKPVSTFEQGSYTQKANSPGRELSIIRQSSLKCATDYVIANGGNITTILHNADILANYVQTGIIPAEEPTTHEMPF